MREAFQCLEARVCFSTLDSARESSMNADGCRKPLLRQAGVRTEAADGMTQLRSGRRHRNVTPPGF
jgi:hypothetical protein